MTFQTYLGTEDLSRRPVNSSYRIRWKKYMRNCGLWVTSWRKNFFICISVTLYLSLSSIISFFFWLLTVIKWPSLMNYTIICLPNVTTFTWLIKLLCSRCDESKLRLTPSHCSVWEQRVIEHSLSHLMMWV